MDATLTIGELAKKAGVGVETIRFYQRRGLISEPSKPLSGFRRYPAETVDRLRFIKRAQELGFTLNEVESLLALGDGHCAETRELASRKLQLIEKRIADLQAMRKVLKDLVRSCDAAPRKKQACPIIATLAGTRSS